jgi:hypothetical protein
MKDYVYYPILFLCVSAGFALGGTYATQSTVKSMLKLCNEKPLECKFKYDILMYEDTGRIPYKEEKKK